MNQKYTKIIYVLITAALFLALGFYVGDRYGIELITETEQERVEQVEQDLEQRLIKGAAVTSVGRIKSINKGEASIVFADQTLAAASGLPQSAIDRKIFIDTDTLLTRQEVEDGPRHTAAITYLQPGQFIRVWLNKADFEAPDVTAEQIIVYQYVSVRIENSNFQTNP